MNAPISKVPNGMRYYFGREARTRRAVEDTIMAVFNGWSYEEIVTPSVDYLALFELGMGREAAHRAFRFTDADGRLLALRPDVTSSVARAAATLFAERERPLRLCYAASVFRQRPQSHAEWRRESKQLGCEFIGSSEHVAGIEMLAIASEIFERLDLKDDYRITINSVEIFNGIAEGLRLDNFARERMRYLIDIRDTSELQRFLAEHQIPAEDCVSFSRLTQLPGKREVLREASRVITNERSRCALRKLEELWESIEALRLADVFEIDLGDVSELDYYTALTFKVYLRGAGSRVGGGGRYDRLIENFGQAEPAIGFVLELDALTEVLMRRDIATPLRTDRELIASPLISDEPVAALTEAREKRRRGERVRVDLKG